jgi:hypothetical protein
MWTKARSRSYLGKIPTGIGAFVVNRTASIVPEKYTGTIATLGDHEHPAAGTIILYKSSLHQFCENFLGRQQMRLFFDQP